MSFGNPSVEKPADTAASITIWRDAIAKELQTAAEWESSWGFLKAPSRPQRRQKAPPAQGPPRSRSGADTPGGLSRCSSTPGRLGNAGQAALSPAVGGAKSLAAFEPDLLENNRFRALMGMQLAPPRERYDRPILTSHQHGWRNTLEMFGASHHGVKRDPNLWPEI
eukprot:TRINITY_DN9445_c0_g1_i1.p1 TRINITY_DN9445_c0_g1~~TRINITY_DN9445_c0_g1_i1.p1  ORF type:complete len:166 (-),score=18.51 TRINITY_DN9445_c0_g1_i1:207-704(-)